MFVLNSDWSVGLQVMNEDVFCDTLYPFLVFFLAIIFVYMYHHTTNNQVGTNKSVYKLTVD